jgi:hypothetical protein
MRFQFLLVICCLGLLAYAKDTRAPVLRSHNDVKLLDQTQSHTEDLQIFPDGLVIYEEAGNYRKKQTFETRLTPAKLQRLASLLNGKAMRAVPGKIGSQIKVIDGRIDKRLEIRHGSLQQVIEIENFYPQLNAGRPAYPRVLVELECMLQDIQRKAAKRPAPDEDQDWCPDALGKR